MCLQITLCFPGSIQAVCPIKEVKAFVGDDALLPCHTNPKISLSGSTVDWKRPDKKEIVFVYRNQKDDPQMEKYADRMKVDHTALQHGELSLLILSVGPSDSGPYLNYIPEYGCGCEVLLNVGETTAYKHTTVRVVLRKSSRSAGGKLSFVLLSTVNRTREAVSTVSPSTRAAYPNRAGKHSPLCSPSATFDQTAVDLQNRLFFRCCPSFCCCIGVCHHSSCDCGCCFGELPTSFCCLSVKSSPFL